MDILDRLNNRLIEREADVLGAAIDEIMKLRQKNARRSQLLADIFNSEAGEALPIDIKRRIDGELMGHNAK